MHFTTSRLCIDALRDADAAALLAYRADPRVSLYQSWQPADLGDARRWIGQQVAVELPAPGQWFQRAIRLRESGRLIGDLGARMPAQAGESAEIGITLAVAQHGQGYAAEALQVWLSWLFEQQVRRVVASVDPRNLACMNLMRRVGLRQEALLVQSVPWRGGWADDAVWALLAHEWPALQAAFKQDRASATR